jgi:DNA-binding IclR family transcriptional regulator
VFWILPFRSNDGAGREIRQLSGSLAVISVIGPIGRMDDSANGPVAKALCALTNRLSRQIGWVPLPPE